MKNLKQLSSIVLCTLFATMQISAANDLTVPVNTGLGNGYGGATINSITGGYAGHELGVNSATLNFNANSHVNWQNLNLNNNETLNFNAVGGANGLTVLNTVNQGMSNIYGQINANNGISKLIISNPNGVFFDGAKFTTAGDVDVTTRDMTGVNVNSLTNGAYTKFRSTDWGTGGNEDLIQVQIKDSNFAIGGDFNIYAPKIVGANSILNANTLKLVTANGADYVTNIPAENKMVTKLTAMNINGDVVVTNDVGAFVVEGGGNINGDLTATTGGWIRVNETSNNNLLNVTGDVNLAGHGQQSIFRHAVVNGNTTMTNDGGFVDMGNVHVKGDANLTTTGFEPINSNKFNHYIHVVGNTQVDGDLNIESSQNIHIGNYDYNAGTLLPGQLTVGGDLKAHTPAGHITTTIDTTAKNIDYNAEKYNDGTRDYGGNILTDGKAVLSADTYKFKSAGYIGGLQQTSGISVDNQIINLMENYTHIPADITSHDYMVVNGGTITKLETPKTSPNGKDVQTYIKSNNDLIVNGANAGVINLVAPDKKITVTGNVHAKEINVGGRTGTLQLDFPNRDFTTNYTNIRDGVVKTIAPTDEITYELTNAPGAYNSPDFAQTNGTNTTYLVGPGAPGPVPPGPTPPPSPTPDNPNPPSDDNVRVRNVVPDDPMKPLVSTPVAFAADIDDDENYGPCRKNVDGSVTVVKAYPIAY